MLTPNFKKQWFQSLIGRLKTEEERVYDLRKILFQSLIGRLKTESKTSSLILKKQVSIPYR